ncbi:hypothetical protein SAMN04515666_11954 [Bosea lupini]|uniref:Uncharacterized protein n=1 Tax=Bosea lupini TaxID=1036779 RepID=A0A1H8AGQ6_9HYPH|nr:hypothetical protein [Bosea lupini]SEM69900.1 hypothetical protein SAMN04515666_11954 [Bosea lupini]
MIAWLDALLPPLDPTIGFWLLVAIAVEAFVVWAYRRARQRADALPDLYGEAHGDVTRRPDA